MQFRIFQWVRYLLFPITALLLIHSRGAAQVYADPDEKFLEQTGLSVDDQSLLRNLAKNWRSDLDPKEMAELLRQLADPNFKIREATSERLVALGPIALDPIREIQKNAKGETAARLKDCLLLIERDANPDVRQAVVRLVARRNLQSAIPGLLNVLPFAATDGLKEETWFALDTLTVRRGRVDAAVKKVAKDPQAARRAAAAYILGRRGTPVEKEAARRLLADPDADVRLRAAQGLLGAKDKAGIPTLIALLEVRPVSLAWQAEELLRWAAGDLAPGSLVGAGKAEHASSCRQAWEKWWEKEGAKFEFKLLDQDPRRPGLVLVAGIASFWGEAGDGSVKLFGCDGGPRWQLEGLSSPQDMLLLPGDRLLVAEGVAWKPSATKAPATANQVTERDLNGKVLWQSNKVAGPRECRALPNGNRFIAGTRIVAEVTPAGVIVYFKDLSFPARPPAALGVGTYLGPQWLPGNRLLYQYQRGRELFALVEIDETGKVARAIQLEEYPGGASMPNVEILANGHFLVCRGGAGGGWVREIDAVGKTVWRSPGTLAKQGLFARHAVRLRSGNTLIAAGPVVELDAEGNLYWEVLLPESQRVRSCLNLVRLGFDGPRQPIDRANSVAFRCKGLRSPDALVKRTAAKRLETMGAKAAAALPALLQAADDSDLEVRRAVMAALQEVVVPGSLPVVMEAAKPSAPARVRVAAMGLFWKFTKTGQDRALVDILLTASRDDDPIIRRNVAATLVFFPSHVQETIPVLVQALKDKTKAPSPGEASVAEAAASSLGGLGPRAASALPALFDILKGQEYENLLRHTVIMALPRIGNASVTVPRLVQVVQDKSQGEFRGAAAGILAQFGPSARQAVPALIEALKEKDAREQKVAEKLQLGAIYTLGEIGPPARAAMPILTALRADKATSKEVRQCCVEALAKIQP
jgi:HEAT repeat protein